MMDGRLRSDMAENLHQRGKAGRGIICIVLLLQIHSLKSDLQTGQFLIHKNKVLTTSLSVISTEECSLHQCAAECLKRKSCCVCSYDESTRVCVIETSGCCNVQTKSSQESVVMVRENKENFTDIPLDCSDILKCWSTISGVFTIYPEGIGALEVLCDMNTDTGGWTVIQNRNSGSTMFYTNWAQYRNGFGNISSDFWIGNDNLHMLTSKRNYHLRVDLEDWDGQIRYAVYQTFMVGDENTKYKLSIGSYRGTAGDSLYYHNDMKFSTTDSDNDFLTDPNIPNCAQQYNGGWWYMICYEVNLHGTYLAWKTFGGTYNDLKHSKMMIRV